MDSGLPPVEDGLPAVEQCCDRFVVVGRCGERRPCMAACPFSRPTPLSTLHNVDELRREGVRIAVDDFGTGYSSLAYLQRLPIDVLKLDRMFTSALEEADERDVRFVGAILGLGASLGLPVVAEGVETARQAAALYDLGCPLAQGFHFGRPCPPDQVSDYLAKDFTLNDELEQTADEPGRWQ